MTIDGSSIDGNTASGSNAGGGGIFSLGGTVDLNSTTLAQEISGAIELERPPKPVVDLVAPESKKLTLLEITEFTCKWPTGDPTRPGFSFCGHKTHEEKPYCEFHSKLAFQPPNERRRRR